MATVSSESLGEQRLTYSRQMPDDSLGVKQSSGRAAAEAARAIDNACALATFSSAPSPEVLRSDFLDGGFLALVVCKSLPRVELAEAGTSVEDLHSIGKSKSWTSSLLTKCCRCILNRQNQRAEEN